MAWPPKEADPALAAIKARQAQVRGKPKAKRTYPEEAEQKRLVEELRWRTIKPARFWAVPNQRGTRARWENQLLSALGVEAGVSDLHFAWPERAVPGFRLANTPRFGVIEMKAPGKARTTTDEQDAFLRDMAFIGHQAAVCCTAEDALVTLEAWGFPLRSVRGG